MDTGRHLHGQSDVPILRWHQHHSVVLGAQTDREMRLPREGHGVAGEPAVPLQRLQEGHKKKKQELRDQGREVKKESLGGRSYTFF